MAVTKAIDRGFGESPRHVVVAKYKANDISANMID